jgi:hypothetical protein
LVPSAFGLWPEVAVVVVVVVAVVGRLRLSIQVRLPEVKGGDITRETVYGYIAS